MPFIIFSDKPRLASLKFISKNFNFESFPRLNIYKESINFIIERPILGWGSASFPLLFFSRNYEWYGHPHNIFLELAISYGLIIALVVGPDAVGFDPTY